MSGFAAIFNLDGAPVDARLLRRMAAFMAFRGPDGSATWSGGEVGFAHTMLRTGVGDQGSGIGTLDQQTWIVADARIDGRADLLAQLAVQGEDAPVAAPDVELILRAYHAWGEQCVEHLIGDFAFAIWDGPRRRLFCARDHLGVKSFFYALAGRTLIVSNTLDCVRLHPGVSDRLNDLAVADFLLFELNHDPETTVYADVRRLTPAHTAVWSSAGGHTKRYWDVPIDEPVFYGRSADYLDRFNELLDQAVSDRLRTDRVGVFMSGGIDSTTLAAVAVRVGGAGSHGSPRVPEAATQVRAFTAAAPGFDRDEARFARETAEHLRIPITVLRDGAASFDANWHTRAIHTPSPIRNVTRLVHDRSMYQTILAHSRVCFYGEGPDNALHYEWWAYARHLAATRRWARLAGDVVRHVRHHRRLPLVSVLRRRLTGRRNTGRFEISYPEWMNPGLEKRLQLRDRWERFQQAPAPAVVHPVRPVAHASFCGVEWEALFRGFDAEETGTPLEVRHPYVDIRVLRYLLSVPVVPWCRGKHLMRAAMRGALPEPVLRRRKSGMTGDPDHAAAQAGLPPIEPHALLPSYIAHERVPEASGSDMIAFRTDFRPRALNYWLWNLQGVLKEEHENDIAHA